MIISVLVLATAVFCGLIGSSSAAPSVVDDASVVRNTRAWRPPELIKVAIYWRSYAKRRAQALNRCERRLFLYVERRKMAKEVMINVAKRSVVEQADITQARDSTASVEASLMECVNQIIALHPNDDFYRDYQHLTTEAQKLTDQIASCEDAGGIVTPVKRDAVDDMGEQRVARSSNQMQRVYNKVKGKMRFQVIEKAECFDSLNIPPKFPFQLE